LFPATLSRADTLISLTYTQSQPPEQANEIRTSIINQRAAALADGSAPAPLTVEGIAGRNV
jgi:hypothetical protein